MIRTLLLEATRRLHAASPTPRLDAELLLADVLGWNRARLLADDNHTPTAAQQADFQQRVARRQQQAPVAYLIGRRGFFGLELAVDERVLVPRPETELLVECALETVATRFANPARPLTLVDVGTGSGAIALALAHHLPPTLPCALYATDISAAALEVAARNLAQNPPPHPLTLLQGDLLTALPPTLAGQIDLLVSNPPYTVLADINPDVYQYEPHLALDGGSDGLHIYRRLLPEAPHWLHPAGSLLLEIGATQAAAVNALLRQHWPAAVVQVRHDLAGFERVVLAHGPPERPPA